MTEPMTPEIALLNAVLDLPADKRATHLDQACAGRPELRRRVEQLLAALERAGSFMAGPAAGEARSTVRDESSAGNQPGDRIGRYKLLEKIGEGGCGVVYVAEQEEPVRRRVALKVIKPGMDSKSVIARFEAERQALAMMDHPNIARVFDAGTTDGGLPYFVMELVRGVPVTEYCNQAKLRTEERLQLFVEVCHAVQHAHQKGIIHRDLKPSNILVTLHDGPAAAGCPKVIDFGIAKATEGRLTEGTVYTQLHQFIGTPAYMSPEQAEMSGLDIDTRSDIYSLGVLLYELLTGSTPFDAQEVMKSGLDALRKVIREEEPSRPSQRLSTLAGEALTTAARQRRVEGPGLIRQVRGDLDWIVMKCLEKDRRARYETANGLAADIQRHLNDEPVTAVAPSFGYHWRKFHRRHKTQVRVIAAAAVLLLAGVVASAWQAWRATQAERSAIALARKAQAADRAARIEADRATQAERILRQMLDEVAVSVDLGRDTAVLREQLEKAEASTTRTLADHPCALASVLEVLAQAWLELNVPRKAESLARASVRLATETHGAEHHHVLEGLHPLADALARSGQHAEAAAVSRQAVAVAEKVRGPTHGSTAYALNLLADHLLTAGEPAEAERMARRALAIHREQQDNRGASYSLHNIGIALMDQQQKAQAVDAFREAHDIRRRVLGDRHTKTLHSLARLANALHWTGKPADAEAAYRELMDKSPPSGVRPNGPIASAIAGLTSLYEDQGRLEDSIALARRSLELHRQVFGNEHPEVAWDLGQLAWLSGVRPDPAAVGEVEAGFRASLDLWRRVGITNDLRHTETASRFGWFLLRERRPAEAETWLRRALANRTNGTAFPNIDAASDGRQLGSARLLQGDAAEALTWFEFARRTLDATPEIWTAQASKAEQLAERLARDFQAQRRFQEAESLNRRLLASRQRRRPPGHPDIASAELALGTSLAEAVWPPPQTQGSSASLPLAREAESLLRSALAHYQSITNTSRGLLGHLRSNLGGAVAAQILLDASLPASSRDDRRREAETLLLAGQELMDQSTSMSPKIRQAGLDRLVQLYEAWPRLGGATNAARLAADWKRRRDALAQPSPRQP